MLTLGFLIPRLNMRKTGSDVLLSLISFRRANTELYVQFLGSSKPFGFGNITAKIKKLKLLV